MDTTGQQRRFIRFIVTAFLGLLGLITVSLHVQAQEQPKPGPEHKKMEVWVGEWTYEGSYEASPLRPASRFKGKVTSRMVLNGFFVEHRWEDNLEQGIDLDGYDPETKTYVSHSFRNDGRVVSSSATVSGNTWTWSGTRTDSKGNVYKRRTVSTFSSDGQTVTHRGETSSDDGKTWVPEFQETDTRVKK